MQPLWPFLCQVQRTRTGSLLERITPWQLDQFSPFYRPQMPLFERVLDRSAFRSILQIIVASLEAGETTSARPFIGPPVRLCWHPSGQRSSARPGRPLWRP